MLYNIPSKNDIDREIGDARNNIKEYLLANPGKKIAVAFSCGKDSLLTALLVREVLEDLGRSDPIYLNVFNSGYEKPTSNAWLNYLRSSLDSRYIFRVCKPRVLFSYSVCVLGKGRFPISPRNIKWCNQIKRGGA